MPAPDISPHRLYAAGFFCTKKAPGAERAEAGGERAAVCGYFLGGANSLARVSLGRFRRGNFHSLMGPRGP